MASQESKPESFGQSSDPVVDHAHADYAIKTNRLYRTMFMGPIRRWLGRLYPTWGLVVDAIAQR